jgi:hypothetical protein
MLLVGMVSFADADSVWLTLIGLRYISTTMDPTGKIEYSSNFPQVLHGATHFFWTSAKRVFLSQHAIIMLTTVVSSRGALVLMLATLEAKSRRA